MIRARSVTREFQDVLAEGGDRIIVLKKLPHHSKHGFIVVLRRKAAKFTANDIAFNKLEKSFLLLWPEALCVYAQHKWMKRR